MKVFVTGATGFVGSAVVAELIRAGHEVTGLARSKAAVELLTAAGAKAHRGDLEDLESLKSGAAASEGFIHLGFVHDFARFQEVCAIDERAIEALGTALVGSGRPLIVTAGTALLKPGQLATEQDVPSAAAAMPRKSEEAAAKFADRGVRASVVRLSPSVHGDGDHGFIPILINVAREKGVSAYVGVGQNRWTAVHRLDAGSLYRLVLEKGAPYPAYHGVAEEGIAFKDIAEMIGNKLGVPVVSKSSEEAAEHFTWFAPFAAIDCPASSRLTQEWLGWSPVQTTLLSDMENGTYFKAR